MNESYRKILDDIESTSPTPGGGAVSALILGHAIALNRMVCGLTIGRDKWVEGHEIANNYLEKSESWVSNSVTMANNDCEAFNKVMMAYRMPKESDEEINERKNAIALANKLAIKSPLDIAYFCLEVMKDMPDVAATCNSNAITDIGTANHLILAATESAALNVKINLSSPSDNLTYHELINEVTSAVLTLHGAIIQIVENRM